MANVQVIEYLDVSGESPFAHWFEDLDTQASAKVATALYRMEQGNFSNVKGVGGGVFEYRIDFGPGYRVYFGKDGETLVILLGGSTKKRQSLAIAVANSAWLDYKRRKKQAAK
jgi:putative addiction module killer protein